jgi:hypothetical protein
MDLMKAIKVCFLSTSLLTISACQGVASQGKLTKPEQPRPAEGPWRELADSAGDFSLRFPREPNHQSVNRNNRLVKEYTLAYDRCLFSFEYFEVEEERTEDGYRRLRNYLQDQTIKANIREGWRLLGQKLLPGNGYETDWAVPSNGTMAYMRRQEFFRNSRAYAIAFYSYDYEDLNGKLANSFFSSLAFNKSNTSVRGKPEG